MRRITIAAGLLGLLSAQASAQERVKGADLFIDMQQYIGKQVILTNGNVFAAGTEYAYVRAGGVSFYMSVDGIDKESFRYFLSNCSGIGTGAKCTMPLLVSLTGEKRNGDPVIKSVKIAK